MSRQRLVRPPVPTSGSTSAKANPWPTNDCSRTSQRRDVVYLGEHHTIPRHHEIQAGILTALAARGVSLALGLEQLESWQQPQLDRYNRGEVDFEQLAAATSWSKRWPNFRQYQPILEAARKRKIPVVALNAKAETIRQVARSGGVERLAAEDRKRLPADMRLQDPAYEKLLSLEMAVHVAATPKTLHPMIEAQIARDEAMAEALAAFLKSPPGKGRKMLVLCGSGHVAYGLGTPARLRRRLPGVNDRIVLLSESGQLRLSAQEKAQARDIEITHQQLRADRAAGGRLSVRQALIWLSFPQCFPWARTPIARSSQPIMNATPPTGTG